MGSLTFQFAGVCTHFRQGVVAGVPYRVVLPEATNVRVGSLQVKQRIATVADQQPVLYYTTPHFPSLQLLATTTTCGGLLPDRGNAADLSSQLTVPSVLQDGVILSGARLQIINATDTVIDDQIGDSIPSLTTFYPTYAPSSEVVLNGRAACYVDIFGGCVWVIPQDDPKPPVILIKVETDGPPQLLVTPLTSSTIPLGTGAGSKLIKVTPAPNGGDDFVMVVNNLEPDPGGDFDFVKGAFDYLLHYLTAKGGIPEVLSARPPGLTFMDTLPSATLKDIGDAMVKMGTALGGTESNFVEGAYLPRPRLSFGTSSPACADSIYP
jgi:hypothetical protein